MHQEGKGSINFNESRMKSVGVKNDAFMQACGQTCSANCPILNISVNNS